MTNGENTEGGVHQFRRLLSSERNQLFGKYLLVGVFGVAINESLLYAVTGILGYSYILGGSIGVGVSTTINYTINDKWTWTKYGKSGFGPWLWRGAKYGATRAMGIGIHLLTLIGLVEYVGLNYLIANLIAIGVGTLWGFGASDTLVWRRKPTLKPHFRVIHSRIQRLVQIIDRHTMYVLLASILVFIGFSIYMALLYRGFWLTGGDFGSYLHAFESLRTGSGFLDTGRYRLGNPTASYWGEHFSLTLFIAYGFYALVPSPYTLIVVKSLALAASIPLVWILARETLKSDRIAGLLTASYALNPFLFSAWIFDFQEQIFLPVLLLGSYLMYERRRYVAFLGLTLLVLATNEFLVIIMTGTLLGYIVHSYHSNRIHSEWHVFFIFGLFLLIVAVVSGIVIGRFNQFSGIPVGAIAEPFHPFIETQRVQSSELVKILLTNPRVGLDSLAHDFWQKGVFFVLLLVPVGFLSLQDEFTLASIAPFIGFAWIFTGQEIYYSFGAHYPLYILPFLYIGAVRVLNSVNFPKPSTRLFTYIFVSIILVNLLGIAGAVSDDGAIPQSTSHMDIARSGLEGIPANATVVTQNDLYPHIAMHPGAKFVANPATFREYSNRHTIEPVDYVVIDSKLDARKEDWGSVVEQAYGSKLGEVYRLYQYDDGVYIFKYGYTGEPTGISAKYRPPRSSYSASDLYMLHSLSSDTHRINGTIESGYGNRGDTVWFGPYESLPPGTYEVRFNLWVSTQDENPPLYIDVTTNDGNRVLAKRELSDTDGWTNVSLPVNLARYQSGMEFRGFRTGSEGTIRLRQISITPIPANESIEVNDGTIESSSYNYPVYARFAGQIGYGDRSENPGCGPYGPSQFDPQPERGNDHNGHNPEGRPCA